MVWAQATSLGPFAATSSLNFRGRCISLREIAEGSLAMEEGVEKARGGGSSAKVEASAAEEDAIFDRGSG